MQVLWKYDGKLSTRKKITKALNYIDLRSYYTDQEGRHYVVVNSDGIKDDCEMLRILGYKESI